MFRMQKAVCRKTNQNKSYLACISAEEKRDDRSVMRSAAAAACRTALHIGRPAAGGRLYVFVGACACARFSASKHALKADPVC